MNRLSRLLFEKGQGWLRWGLDTRTDWRFPEYGDYTVAPPLRRVVLGFEPLWFMIVGFRKTDWDNLALRDVRGPWWRREWFRPYDPWGIGHQWFRDPDRKGLFR